MRAAKIPVIVHIISLLAFGAAAGAAGTWIGYCHAHRHPQESASTVVREGPEKTLDSLSAPA